MGSLILSGKPNHPLFIMAHGAGAPMDSEWMNNLTEELLKKNIQIGRFDFPYMQERRASGKKRPPNSTPILQQAWQEIFESAPADVPIFVGGKSMGGRIASLMVDQWKTNGLICLGFPFHAPGKPPGDRIDHLKLIKTPTLIIQGERDLMGSKIEVNSYSLSKKIKIHFLTDGDHSFKPRKKSGAELQQHLVEAANEIHKFMGLRASPSTTRSLI